MADYNKATNFTAKDGLPTGNAGKIVKGAEIDTELTAVSNAIASKADINSPTFTGTPAAPTASAGTNTTQVATTAHVFAERTNIATLTNKTLTSPTINTPTISTPTITGGTITGITDLTVADGGTGASTLAANAVLLGNGTSALQTVAPSTAGNLLTSNGTTWTSATPAGTLGVSQSYTNVTGSRSNGTSYTNSTGKPILVIVGGSDASGQGFNLTVVVGGVTILTQAGSPAGNTQTSSFIVPDSTSYTVTWNASANFNFWVELR